MGHNGVCGVRFWLCIEPKLVLVWSLAFARGDEDLSGLSICNASVNLCVTDAVPVTPSSALPGPGERRGRVGRHRPLKSLRLLKKSEKKFLRGSCFHTLLITNSTWVLKPGKTQNFLTFSENFPTFSGIFCVFPGLFQVFLNFKS